MAESSESAPAAKGGGLKWIAIAAGASLLSAAGTFVVVSRTVAPPAAGESHAPAAPGQPAAAEHADEGAAEQHGGGTSEHASSGGDEHASAPAQEHAPPPSAASGHGATVSNTFELETFVVNINDGERDRFLKLKPELELSDPAAGEELKARMPQVKDIVISLLSSQSFSQIRTIEGKDALREELMLRLNALLRSGKVSRVFFTEFVVQ
jgi:flagellar protein FliL